MITRSGIRTALERDVMVPPTLGSIATTCRNGTLRQQLLAHGAVGSTVRLAVRGVAGGWLYLHEGLLYCAERAGRPTLVVAMAEAGLFTPEEWAMALRLPYGPKWPALVGGDEDRLGDLATFARTFLLEHVASLLEAADRHDVVPTTFAANVTHPFGPIERWSVEDVLAELPAPPPRDAVPVIDRAEFLELLEEVSPHVRRDDHGRVSIVDTRAIR